MNDQALDNIHAAVLALDTEVHELQARLDDIDQARTILMGAAELLGHPVKAISLKPGDKVLFNGEPRVITDAAVVRRSPGRPRGAKNKQPTKVDGRKVYDYAEVAEIANRAAELVVGKRMLVAQHYGITEKAADNLIYRARQAGHEITKGPPASSKRRPVPAPEPAEIVDSSAVTEEAIIKAAEYYLDAHRSGRAPVQRVMDELLINRVTAVAVLAACRFRGLLPDRDQPQLPDAERREILDNIPNQPGAHRGRGGL